MRIFKDKNGTIYIVAGKGEENPNKSIHSSL